jgi:hypothetical protein
MPDALALDGVEAIVPPSAKTTTFFESATASTITPSTPVASWQL